MSEIFLQYDQFTDFFLPTDRDTGKFRGFAFVTMPASEAETAFMKTDGEELERRPLQVNEAQPKGVSGGRGGGGYNDGYEGGGGNGGGRGGYIDRGRYGGGRGYGGGGSMLSLFL